MEKKCGCKGIRSCLLCEKSDSTLHNITKNLETYIYCIKCRKAWNCKSKENGFQDVHPNHNGTSIQFDGVEIINDFVTFAEEDELVAEIDETKWKESQSGRRKQDYGPKVNFKKKKIKCDGFSGLPSFIEPIVQRLHSIPVLNDFTVVEQCNLEYCSDRGAGIDPHFDDFWLWGERLVTLSLLTDSFLSMTNDSMNDIEILLPMTRRSLIILTGKARYEWKHSISREDITGRRIAITFRELTPEFLHGGENEKLGLQIIELAQTFDGKAV